MEAKSPPISVLLSAYNERADFLKRSVESVLHQAHNEFEFIIINDGSTEKECLRILNEYARKDCRIILINNKKNLGLTASLNIGLREARGKYIARIDSDDIADTRRLEKQLQFMEKNPELALCGTWSYLINENEEIIGEKKLFTDYDQIKRKLLFFNFFTHSSLFFKKKLVIAAGGYNEDMKRAQDYDLILKISARYPIANIPEFLCFHRTHEKNISSRAKKKQEWCALKARWRAISLYGYPKIYFLKIIPSFFYFLFVPYFIEKQIFKLLWHK